ncbi:hypothetical protein T03_237 [Trichinella britovi]|uniref:Uncharacterized protein n=1 Tax=Trichinella britovi TaxID=45882 RepID=A0A0V1CA37_TRIBR|nr:hypothetical protein T03_237 [Trichinella britovi]
MISFPKQLKIFDFSKKQGYSLCCFCDFRNGFWKVPMQTNRYLLSKLLLNFACAYVNTQESSDIDTLQKQRQYA